MDERGILSQCIERSPAVFHIVMIREVTGMKKILKWFLWIVAAAGLILVLCGIYLGTRDYSGYFTSAIGSQVVRAEITPFETDSLFRRGWLSLTGIGGLSVECGFLVPADGQNGQRYPAVILMGGKATGKHAIDYAIDIRNVLIAAPDYAYQPREEYTLAEFLSDVPEMRGAALSMVPSVMLLSNYLWQRPDVDTTRLILLGYSFGAPFVPCIAAYDRRPAAVVMVFGGGDLRGMIRHNVRRYRGPIVSDLAGSISAVLLRPLEPLRYADRISPMPLVMINGTDDEQVPRQYAEEFFSAAEEPKKIVWLEARHVNPRNEELTRRIVQTMKEELVRLNVLTEEN